MILLRLPRFATHELPTKVDDLVHQAGEECNEPSAKPVFRKDLF